LKGGGDAIMLTIKGAKIYTITKGVIDKGTVLIDGVKIIKVGARVGLPEKCEVIDAAGKVVTPGLIDAHAHVSIWEEGFGWEGNDVNELTDPVTAQVRAIDAINPEDQGLTDAVQGGVTAVWSAPGSGNVIGGEGITMRTYGKTVDDMALRSPYGLKAAFGENPKRVYSAQKKMPSTRMGTAAVLREALTKAQNYLAKQEKAKTDPDKAPDRDLKMEALARVLRREYPLRTHAHRADDILTALRIAEEFNIIMTIEHCTEGHKIADLLAEKGIACVVGPSLTSRSKVELRGRNLKTPGVLAKAGVKVALMTDHPVIPVQYLTLAAGLAIREGMDEEAAMRAVTINAAEICGVGERLGSIEEGKEADLVVWTGHPFELKAKVAATIIGGKVVYKAG
jgi:imidazolonepropionase-like amidohydrolase